MENYIGPSITLDFVKRANRSLVLELIKNDYPISRAQIARELGLSKPTVSSIVNELLQKSLIVDLGEQPPEKGAGRPAHMLGFNPCSAYALSISMDGSETLILTTDLLGKVLREKSIPNTNKLDDLIHEIDCYIEESGLAQQIISAMGMSIPGTVSEDGVVLHSGTLNWHSYDVLSILKKHYSFPIFLFNDANCALLGERWQGSGENSDDIFYISIGTGIGGAIISGGHILNGYQSLAAEICYQIGTDDIYKKRFNVLGQTGVFEQKVSTRYLSSGGYDYQEVVPAYSAGDVSARGIIDSFILELSVVIANAIGFVNPEKVIIGGPFAEYMQPILPEIQRTVDALSPIHADICLASLGKYASALGAIAYAFQQIEQND